MTPWLPADWPAPRGVHAGTTLRHGSGVSAAPFDHLNLGNHRGAAGDEPAAVARNRALLVDALRLPAAPRWLRQVHGTQVVRVDADAPADEPEADAAVTSVPGLVLAILTADCLPVVLASTRGDEIACAHAGWRGLAAGMLEATVAAMHTPPRDLVAWLGPAAGPGSYEVGEEVYDAFVAPHWGDGAAFTSTRPHHWRVDLYALARRRLVTAGLDPARIHGGGLDTIADAARFFSHRRDTRTGRMATLAWITG